MKHRIIKPINERSRKNKHIWSNKSIPSIRMRKYKPAEDLYSKTIPILNIRYTSYLFRSFGKTHSMGGCKVKALNKRFMFDPSTCILGALKRKLLKERKI